MATGRPGTRSCRPGRTSGRGPAGRRSSRSAAVDDPWQFAPGFSKVMTLANNELTAVIEGKQTVNGMLAKVQEAANEALR